MKKLFTIACPVILATLGVALLFVIRKKRKEKRLKRLRGNFLGVWEEAFCLGWASFQATPERNSRGQDHAGPHWHKVKG